jgi:hypothetical protein
MKTKLNSTECRTIINKINKSEPSGFIHKNKNQSMHHDVVVFIFWCLN